MGTTAFIVFAVRVITLAEAERAAVAHQPQIAQATAQSEAARARHSQALAPMLPQLSATADLRLRTQNVAQGVIGPIGGVTGFYNFGASASQLLWDFGLTLDRYRAARHSVSAAEQNEAGARNLALQNLRATYFAAHANRSLIEVARAAVGNYEKHLGQIEGFVRVGARAEIDLAQARTDLANGRVQLIGAENQYLTSKAQLNQAMGVIADTDYDVTDETLGAVQGEDGALDPLVTEATRERPDLAALERQAEAQRLTISAARGAYFPRFAVGTGGTAAGNDITGLAYNWNLSLNGTWGFFEGGLTLAQVREARANLAVLEAQLRALQLQARLEVEQARLAVRAAKATVGATTEALTNARERLRLAEGRYSAGVGNIIELGDAQVAATSAAAQLVQAGYSLAVARAQLLRALGRR